jgi:hypothetical protein
MKRTLAVAALLLPSVCPAIEVTSRQILIESRIVEVGPGIRSADFRTNLGDIFANLPIDAASGDRISGTLAAVPKGKTDADRKANADSLGSLSLGICGGAFPVSGGTFFCPKVPEKSLELILMLGDRPLDRVAVDVPEISQIPVLGKFFLPAEGLAYNRARIGGPLSGDLTRTKVLLGDAPAHVVAESPRVVVFDVPEGPPGKVRIEIHDGDHVLSGEFRIVGLRLTPPRPIIHTGDTTAFSAEVTGLTGLERPIPMTITNLSPGIVSMEGGNRQEFTITPSDVSAAGTYPVHRKLTGIHRGDYVVNVSIPWDQRNFEKPEPGAQTGDAEPPPPGT